MSVLRNLTAVLAVLLLCGCKSELYTNLSDRAANQIFAALQDAGIPAEKQAGRSEASATILVADSDFAQAMAVLEARGLPNRSYQSFCGVFESGDMLSSPMEQQARMICAMTGELNQTIAEIDGIVSARTHVVPPDSDMLGRETKPSSASVSIRHLPEAPIDQLKPSIKNLVANSIKGLEYDKVVVVSFPATDLTVPGQAMKFETFLGISVLPGSLARLQLVIGGAALIVVLSLIAAAVPWIGKASRIGSRRQEDFL